jgi:hypothetical protein
MISLVPIYEKVIESTEIKSIRKKSFPPEETDGEVVSVKSKDTKGENEEVVVKPEDDEPVIIRRKKK